jgi:hypothetical protein
MTSIETSPTAIRLPEDDVVIDDAQLAATRLSRARPARSTSPWANEVRARSCDAETANALTDGPLTGGPAPSASGPGSAPSIHTCSGLRSSWPRSTRGVPLRDVQLAARHADPRTTTIYDRRRQNFDRHAAYVVVAFVAGG